MSRTKPALKAVENDLVPDDPRGEKPALAVRCPAVVDLYVVDDVEGPRRPRLLPAIPPCVVVNIIHAFDAKQGNLDAVVALAFVRPAQQVDQLEAGELDLALGEIAFQLGELDQGEYDRIVGGGRQAVFFRTLDDPLAGNKLLPPCIVNLVLEFDASLAFGNPVGEQGDGELGEVHLILAQLQQGRDRFRLLKGFD